MSSFFLDASKNRNCFSRFLEGLVLLEMMMRTDTHTHTLVSVCFRIFLLLSYKVDLLL